MAGVKRGRRARAFHKLLGPGREGGGVLPYKRLMALIFLYIFCNSTISKLQKMYGKIEVLKTDRGLLCTPDLVYCFFELVSYSFQTESIKYIHINSLRNSGL